MDDRMGLRRLEWRVRGTDHCIRSIRRVRAATRGNNWNSLRYDRGLRRRECRERHMSQVHLPAPAK